MENNSIEKINDSICIFLKDLIQLDRDRYYNGRFLKREIFDKNDRDIIEWVLIKFKSFCKILEVGGGIGQVGHALSLFGYSNVHICEMGRFDLCKELGVYLQSNAVVLRETFPKCCGDLYDLVIAANVASISLDLERDMAVFKKEILPFAEILFVPSLYGEVVIPSKAMEIVKKSGVKYKEISDKLVLLEGVECKK